MEGNDEDVVVDLKPCFRLFKDGSVQRIDPHLLAPPYPPVHGVSVKDLTFNADLGLWARVLFPTSLLDSPPIPHRRLPVVVNFHGGGFIYGGPATNHHFCSLMVNQSASIWISPSYRLAPEHRLPTAFDDGMMALTWLHSQALLQVKGGLDDSVFVHADFSRFFLAGASTGGLLAHRIAIRALNDRVLCGSASSGGPLCIRGLVLVNPSFLRTSRSKEEMEGPQELRIDQHAVDLVMDLVLPPDASRDHPFLNPLLDLSSMDSVVLPKTLVCIAELDGLRYVEMEYIQALKDAGCQVESIMSTGVGHIFYTSQPDSQQAKALRAKIGSFILEE